MSDILLGFSRKDISPDFPHCLSGYGDDPTRPMEGILDRVYGTCLAIADAQGQTALMYSLDLLLISLTVTEILRKDKHVGIDAQTEMSGDDSGKEHEGHPERNPEDADVAESEAACTDCRQDHYSMYEAVFSEYFRKTIHRCYNS